MTTRRDDAPRDPAPPSVPSPPLRKPTPDFMSRLAVAVRGGARPSAAAEWLGVPRSTYKAWLKRKGEPYDTLRATQRSALAHLKVRLQAELAKRSPEKALRALQAREQQADEGRRYSEAPRPYTKAGHTLVQRALPYLTERVLDAAIPAADLSPVERAARAWRDDVIADLGGVKAITTTKMALLNASVASMIILSSIDAYLFELAGADGLASRKHRRLFPVVEQRMRIADSLARQLQALGLDRAAPPVQSLHEYLATRAASEPTDDTLPTSDDEQETS